MISRYTPSIDDVIRIEMIEAPREHEVDEGIYEWRFKEDKHLMDIITLEKELMKLAPQKCERILDRLYNFRKVYLNMTTGEISS